MLMLMQEGADFAKGKHVPIGLKILLYYLS
jgi:hypothetical protein